jgi:thioredoxin-disulfide reductase
MPFYDLIIIGGGPAGTTAGIYAARQKLKTLLIAKSFGGQVVKKAVGIENYPGFKKISGLDLIGRFEKHLKSQEVDIKQDGVKKIEKKGKIFIVKTVKDSFKAKAVIIASGADPRPLEVPGEKKFIGRGVSYCATCDAPLFSNKTVAVIGGGNSGLETALFLSQWARKVYILEYASQLKKSDQSLQKSTDKKANIEIITSAELKKVQGKKLVESIIYKERKSGKNISLLVDGIFVEIGYHPATSFVKNLVKFNKRDEIMINPRTGETKTAGLFAAGDVTDVVFKQIVVAAGEGCKAALSASNYLRQ